MRVDGAGGEKTFTDDRGVTLMEVVVVCAILSAVCMVGVEAFEGMGDTFRVRRAVREVSALLEWTRWETIRHGCVHRVEFDVGAGTVHVYREIGEELLDGEGEEVRDLDLRGLYPGVVFGVVRGTRRTSGCRLVDPSGIHLRDHQVKFYPTGTVDRSGSIYMMPEADLPGRMDRMQALSILLSTGRVQLWRYDPLAESECSLNGGWVAVY